MKKYHQQHFDFLYRQHLTNLTLQGKRPSAIDAYSRAVCRITAYFDRCPDINDTRFKTVVQPPDRCRLRDTYPYLLVVFIYV